MWSVIEEQKGEPPFKRSWHSSFLHKEELFVFGGSFLNGSDLYVFNDLHKLNLSTLMWNKVETSGERVNGLWASSVVQTRDHIIFFGGRDPSRVYNSIFKLHLDSFRWELLRLVDSPFPRCAAGISQIKPNQILVFGGDGNDGIYYNDVWLFNIENSSWKCQTTKGSIPSPRSAHGQIIVGTKLYVFGGTDGSYIFNDLYELNSDNWTWITVAPNNCLPPSPRYGLSIDSIIVGGHPVLVIIGGDSSDQDFTVHLYLIDLREWRRITIEKSVAQPSSGLFGHCSVLHNGKIYMFGGQNVVNYYSKALYIFDTTLISIDKTYIVRSSTVPKSESGNSLTSPRSNKLKPIHQNRDWKLSYDVIKKIGRGGFSVTASVKLKGTNQIFAAKKTTLTGSNPENKRRALNEMKSHKTFDFPFIVPFHEGYRDQNYLVIIMELCEGGDLYQLLQNQRRIGKYLTEDQIMVWFVELLLAVDYLHKKNFLHCDLKSANVFFTKDYRLQLGDFGMITSATALAVGEARNYKLKKEVNGTPEYMSPAVIQYEPHSIKSDIWACAVILYEMTTLVLPFTGASIQIITEHILRKPYEPIPSCYSKDLDNLLQHLLCKKETLRLNISQIFQLPYVEPYVRIVMKQYSDLFE